MTKPAPDVRSRPHIPDDIRLPEQELMLRSVAALYEKIEHLEYTVTQQRQQLQHIAVELLLRGLWKPIEILKDQLEFRHSCCMIGSYDFIFKVDQTTAENPELVRMKQDIFRIFSDCFQPHFPCYVCETDTGLNTVLLNVPDFNSNEHHIEKTQLLSAGWRFLDRVEAELDIKLNLSLGSCCMDLRNLPFSLDEVSRLRQLQDSVPWVSALLYAGRLDQLTADTVPDRTVLEQQMSQAIMDHALQDIHHCIHHLLSLELQEHHDTERLCVVLRKQVEYIHQELGFEGSRLDILLEFKKSLAEVKKTDELLQAVTMYFQQLHILESNIHEEARIELSAESIKRYIDMHFKEADLNLSRIAETLHTTENNISKVFKRHFRIGTLNYIQKLRVQAAMVMLMQENTTIPNVALSTGFSNRRTFDRVFRQYTGTTAAQYRRNHK